MSDLSTYPLPANESDARFTTGMVIDAADFLEAHGFPRPTSNQDWARLQQSLFTLIYAEDNR